ncbi:5-methyltetrahydropteroyltriglutamate--homocysteine S-methyltransferase [Paenibacillus hunanensis]|uniref:5-methyltetrahydropteroyltriglutamate--homocysteine methyltransferase n=1 Tax=Paenibacillus hunanensis TaxID=539262 RepID=A0ABU1ITC8_9BACL|nr:5-methyltetrahydropteroyltriglutamate--homocysteine S-methyltransferase [Paenibacillus hunanensis]MDR6242514.1 5-methyltetrahydropteroyltriglutamate--homocysteine methyltransferase [Paenibacillus hunanensis]GGJ08372.1 5-methyltetrahydropteroyltriglutamate--homocysteine methyltransferase [Paenibacillus hunanensis]
MPRVLSSNLGYPRLGEQREWKKTLESYWSGKTDKETFQATMKELRLDHLRKQQQAGIDLIPVGDFSYYDHVLDTAVTFGLVPARFGYTGGEVTLEQYFGIARGTKDAAAGAMVKWFNTNYHYIVPELNGLTPQLTENRVLKLYLEAKKELGIEGKPVLVGPYTFLKLSRGYESNELAAWLDKLVPLYAQVIKELNEAGASWIQIDEPSLALDVSAEEWELVHQAYTKLNEASGTSNLIVQTYFEGVDGFGKLIDLPVQGIGLDFVYGLEQNLNSLDDWGFPEDKVIGVGLIDGRNIWRSNLEEKLGLINVIAQTVSRDRILLQPSCSLQLVPVTTKHETALEPVLRDALAFADEKLGELALLTRAANAGGAAVQEELEHSRKAVSSLASSAWRTAQEPHTDHSATRNVPFEERRSIHEQKWQLPVLPTTTIGSFPQTVEVRRARRLWRTGEWTQQQYEQFIENEIREWIDIQEELGIDVLVHGEFERTDMVEFFGEQLDGFAFTKNGWVQSYGSRCVKPPVIYGNVSFVQPMTVKETKFAQSLTSKPVKGMLTGPVTILNWSFVRDDIARSQVSYQIARAISDEILALEAAGIEMIQVDEPALREGLPLKRSKWQEYLEWAVGSFRLSTAAVKETTQIHTHMCYSEFHDIIDAIKAMDADVISIETSRSHGELISSFEVHGYDKGIGLGVYDIHSPRVPAKEEIVQLIERALRVLDPKLFWINPDCGLKTRQHPETVAALKLMVEAAHDIRRQLGQEVEVNA